MRFALICTLLGASVSLVLALLSEGGYQDDALTHYLYALWAWNDPVYLVDEWGRPGLTMLLFPFARFGWMACRIEFVLISALSVWLAFAVARRLALKRASWIPLLCFTQPVFLLASYTTLTETVVAFYLILAIWFMVRGQSLWSAIVVSLCFVTRYETLVFAPIWAVALWPARRGKWAIALLLWAPLAQNLIGMGLMGRWTVGFILSGKHPGFYGSGTALTMLVKSMATFGPAVAVSALASLVVWRGRGGWITPVTFATYLFTHSAIFAAGAYASGGYPRFLVAVSPLAAICAVQWLQSVSPGHEHRRRALLGLAAATALMLVGLLMEDNLSDEAWVFLLQKVRLIVWIVASMVIGCALAMIGGRRTRIASTLLALTAAGITVLPLAFLIRPHAISVDGRAMESASLWLKSSEYSEAPTITTNIWGCYFLGRSHNIIPPESPDILGGREKGTVFMWDANHSAHPRFGLTLEVMQGGQQWRQVWQSDELLGKQPAARIFVRG